MAKRTKKATTNVTKISVHPQGGFRKYIAGHMFYLGTDQSKAVALADWIIELSPDAKQLGGWTDDLLALVESAKSIQETTGTLPPHYGFQQPNPIIPTKTETVYYTTETINGNLYDAVDAFIEHIKRPNNDAELTWINECCRRAENIKSITHLNGDTTKTTITVIADLPLANFRMDEITEIMDVYKSLVSKKIWSVTTAINQITTFRQFLGWLNSTGKYEWNCYLAKCMGWKEEITKVKKALNKKKPSANGNGNGLGFTIDELTTLYANANPRQRMLMIYALNTGSTSIDISTLTKSDISTVDDEFKFDGVDSHLMVQRDRHKTNVHCKYRLWDITAEMLQPYIDAAKADDESIIKSRNGCTLVYSTKNGNRVDTIQQTWAKLLKKCGMPTDGTKSFKQLRKTGSQIIRNTSGAEMSEVYLSHAATLKGVYNVYADWDKFWDALDTILQHCYPMFAYTEALKDNKRFDRNTKNKVHAANHRKRKALGKTVSKAAYTATLKGKAVPKRKKRTK